MVHEQCLGASRKGWQEKGGLEGGGTRARGNKTETETESAWVDRGGADDVMRIYPNRSIVSGSCVRTCAVWEVDKFQQEKNI